MPADMLTKEEHPIARTLPMGVARKEEDELRAARSQRKRVRRMKLNVAAWILGTILLTTVWVVNEWQANGAFDRFGHEGNPGDWNPTLWALAVGIWGLIVGIMALRVYLPRLQFHVAAWVLGMIVLTPLWALIEWQDNGGFERFSNDSQPGEWDPWILYVGGVWAFVIAILALQMYLGRRTAEAETKREVPLKPSS